MRIADNPRQYDLPFSDWRPLQQATIQRIEDSDARIVLLQGQTGFGKSGVAATLAAVDGGATVLTKTIQLQEQYLGYGGQLVKGRPNFWCPYFDCRASDVDACPASACVPGLDVNGCITNENFCAYRRQFRLGEINRLAITNYSFGLRVLGNHTGLSGRPWLVLDEGHGLLSIMEDVLKEEWLEAVDKCKEHNYAVDAGTRPPPKKLPPAPVPLWASREFRTRILPYAERVLVMSATLPPPELWSAMHGINQSDILWLDAPNVWPDASPIYVWPVAAVNRLSDNEDYEKLATATDRILDKYPNTKGLVHPHSYAMLKELKLRMRNNPRIIWGDGNRGAAIKEFLADKSPRVLVATAVTEGLDLPYELGFQVITKIPFPYLGDERVRGRKAALPAWYIWETISGVVQAIGRMQRAPDDRGDTWILDGSVVRLFKQHPTYWPEWVKRQVKIV